MADDQSPHPGRAEGMREERPPHDVRYVVGALCEAAMHLGNTDGLDTKLLAAAHLLNYYAEQARTARASGARITKGKPLPYPLDDDEPAERCADPTGPRCGCGHEGEKHPVLRMYAGCTHPGCNCAVFRPAPALSRERATREEGMSDERLAADRYWTAAANVLLAFHDWPQYESGYANQERRAALDALAEAADALRAALREGA